MADSPQLPMHGRNHRRGGSDPTPFEGMRLVGNNNTVEIDDALGLFFDDNGFNLTDIGGSTGILSLDSYASFVPTLTGTTSDPDLGSGGTIGGRWVELGQLKHYVGAAHIGTSPDIGSGFWKLSSPINAIGYTFCVGTACIIENGVGTPGAYFPFQVLISQSPTTLFSFAYPQTFPWGTIDLFPGVSTYTPFSAGSAFYWNILYV